MPLTARFDGRVVRPKIVGFIATAERRTLLPEETFRVPENGGDSRIRLGMVQGASLVHFYVCHIPISVSSHPLRFALSARYQLRHLLKSTLCWRGKCFVMT